jgi:hypothetical protein
MVGVGMLAVADSTGDVTATPEETVGVGIVAVLASTGGPITIGADPMVTNGVGMVAVAVISGADRPMPLDSVGASS